MARKRKKRDLTSIEQAKQFGREALQDAREDISQGIHENIANQVVGFAEIPKLEAQQSNSVDQFTQAANNIEQTQTQQNIPDLRFPSTTRTVTPVGGTRDFGYEVERLAREKAQAQQNNLTADDKQRIAEIDENVRRLGSNRSAINDRRISGLLSEKNKLIEQTLSQSKADQGSTMDKWLDTDYKMTDAEVNQAKELIRQYENTEYKNSNIYNLTEEEQQRQSQINALRDKVSKVEAGVYGSMNAAPGVDALLKAGDNDYYGWTVDDLRSEVESRGDSINLSGEQRAYVDRLQRQIDNLQRTLNDNNAVYSTGDAAVDQAIGATTNRSKADVLKEIENKQSEMYKIMLEGRDAYESDYDSYSTRKANAQKQNPVQYTGADLATRAIESMAIQGAAGDNGIVADLLADTATDTLPEYLSNRASGMSDRELYNNLGANIGLNSLINLGVYGAQNADDIIDSFRRNEIPTLNSADDVVADATRQAEVDPLALARQNEIDANALNAERQQIVDNIENATQNVSSMDRGHDLAERIASAYHDFDAYDYADSLQNMDDFIEQMAADINDGNDLTAYINNMIEYADDIDDPADAQPLNNLIKELQDIQNTRQVANAAQPIANQVNNATSNQSIQIPNNLDERGSYYYRLLNDEDFLDSEAERIAYSGSFSNGGFEGNVDDIKYDLEVEAEDYFNNNVANAVPDIPKVDNEITSQNVNADNVSGSEIPEVTENITPDDVNLPANREIVTPDNVNSSDVPPTGGNNLTTDTVNPQGDSLSRFAPNTIRRGTNLTPEEYAANIDLNDFLYESKSERQSMEEAFQMIREEGVDNLKTRLMSDDATDLAQNEIDALMAITRTNNATARAMELVGEDASALRTETNEIYKKLRQQATSNAQALQALAKWTRNTPEGMLMRAENIISGNIEVKQSKLREALRKFARQHKDFNFSPEFERRFMEEAEKLQDLTDMDSTEAKDIMARLGKMVNDEIPVKLGEKVQSYLMDSMLGNVRTLLTRNAGGNLGLNTMEQFLTRPLAAGLDRLVSNKTGVRTQAGLSREALSEYMTGFTKGLRDEAHDIKTGLHTARTGENTLENAIRSNRHVFKNKVGDKLDSLVKNGLSIGDRPFYEATYNQTLGDYHRLREAGVMGETVQKLSDEVFDEYAKTAANLNALAAVYQNDSMLSNALLGLKNGIGDLSEGMIGVDILSQFSMPFVKTPANVVDRAIDYSPLGIIRNAIRTGKEGGIGGANFDQNRFVNETARNIIGSGLMGGGVAATAGGLMSGGYSEDKDEKQAQKNANMQEYALNIPGTNMQMDISWIPVLGSNLVAAAAGYDAYKNSDDAAGLAVAKGAEEGTQALFDQSMFQGLQRLFGTGESYDTDSTIVGNMMNVAKSGLGQAIPSMVRQIAQVTDRYQRDVANSNEGLSYGPLDNYNINSLANNVPILRELALNPKVDASGNPIEESQGRNLASRILEDMVLPGKLTEVTTNPLDEEAKRLSEITKNKTSYMPKPKRSDVDTENYTLTNDEWLEYQTDYGTAMTKAGETLMNTPLYKESSNIAKENTMSNLYSAVKSAINSKYTNHELSGAAKVYKEEGLDAAIDYIQSAQILKDYGLDNNEKNRELVKTGGEEALKIASQTKEYANEAGVATSTKLGGLIEEAVASGNDAQAQSIVDSTVTLKDLGLDKPGPAATYVVAQNVISGLTPEQFAQTYKQIDTDGNQGIKQGEIIDHLNNMKITNQQNAMDLWKAYGNSTWKKVPYLGDDGVWILKAK